MSFDELWQVLEAKKPALKGGATVEFSVANFKALLRQVFEQGVKQGSKSSEVFDKLFGRLGR